MTTSVLSLPQGAEAPARSFRLLSLKPAAPAPESSARRISSQSLLQGERELVIQHQGSEYHLRLTRNDKLILTK
ncbi:hemin uptake protein HemP [Dyella sedimenti]|uniref:hemin uptake protein HemP n=1 Tax=Dyella sedimenti TaxID=2919947 RepID=UPI001FAA8662|nr:hemin uptake protein HemP [Dyella sedimenti]